jgi:hypothetical protein
MEDTQLVFNIKLTLDQVNVILSTMGKLPYETISPLMYSIQAQANTQMQEYQAANAQSGANETDSTVQ